MFRNDPTGSGEYCPVFSLPITTVTKSLGRGGGGGWRQRRGLGVRVVSAIVGQTELHCRNIPRCVSTDRATQPAARLQVFLSL